MAQDDYISRVLAKEGGYSDDPDDRGGATYRGVTYRLYQAYCRIQGNVPSAIKHRSLTEDQVRDIYMEMFVTRYKIDKFNSDWVKEAMFSSTILHGPYYTGVMAQQAAGNLIVDGVIGTKSISRINFLPPVAFVNSFSCLRILFTDKIAVGDTSQKKFLVGWHKQRILRFISPRNDV